MCESKLQHNQHNEWGQCPQKPGNQLAVGYLVRESPFLPVTEFGAKLRGKESQNTHGCKGCKCYDNGVNPWVVPPLQGIGKAAMREKSPDFVQQRVCEGFGLYGFCNYFHKGGYLRQYPRQACLIYNNGINNKGSYPRYCL